MVCGVPTERVGGAGSYPERCSGLVYGVPLGHGVGVNGAKMRVSDDETDLTVPMAYGWWIGFQTLLNPYPSKSLTLAVANSVTPKARRQRAVRVS